MICGTLLSLRIDLLVSLGLEPNAERAFAPVILQLVNGMSYVQ